MNLTYDGYETWQKMWSKMRAVHLSNFLIRDLVNTCVLLSRKLRGLLKAVRMYDK